jgi:hypothetical protein
LRLGEAKGGLRLGEAKGILIILFPFFYLLCIYFSIKIKLTFICPIVFLTFHQKIRRKTEKGKGEGLK